MTLSVGGPGVPGVTKVYAPDGTLIYTGPPVQDPNGHDVMTEDSNGNYLSSTTNAGGVYGGTFYDTLGRTYATGGTIPYMNPVVTTSQGTSLYQATYSTIRNLSTHFQRSGVSECSGWFCTMYVVRSLALPDAAHSTYYFTYDCDSTSGDPACGSPGGQTYYYGELKSVTLATGGTISYTHTLYRDSYGNYGRWVASRTSGSGTWTYTPQVLTTCGSSDVDCQQQTTVQAPTGTKTIYTFRLNNGAWPITIVKKDSGGRTLSTVNNTWDFTQNCVLLNCHGKSYVRLLSQTTTLNTPSGTSITKKSTYSYDTPQTANVTSAKEWKFYPGTSPTFPSVPDRATYVSYYTAGQIINKPLKTTVCGNTGSDVDCPGGGSKVSQTIITYDSYGGNLSLASGASNHDDAGYGTSYTARGNPTQIQQWVSGSTYLASSRQYDTTGQVVKMIDPAGNATLFSYGDVFYTDNGANPPQSFSPPQNTHAYVTQITLPTVASGTMSLSRGYFYGSGKLAVESDQNSAKAYRHFMDALDRPTQAIWPATDGTLPNPTGGNVTTYPSATEADVYTPVGDTSPSATCTSCRQSQFLYDSLGRKTTQALANAPGGAIKTDTTYDSSGRVQSVSHPYVNSSDPTHVFETFTYDALDRTIARVHPDGQSAQSQYGLDVALLYGNTSQLSTTYGYGYPTISQDESGKQRQQWIDGFGRVIEVDEPSTNLGYATASVSISTGPGGQSQNFDPCQPHSSCPQTAWNSGAISITVNGFVASASYGQVAGGYSTPQTVAASLATVLNGSTSPVSATANGGSVLMTAKTAGAGGNFSFSTSATYYNSSCPPYNPCFSGPGLSPSPASGSLTGGTGGVATSPFGTFYAYDAASRLQQVVQGAQTRAFVYDGLGRPTSITTPEAGTDTLVYDADSSCPTPNSFPGHLVKKLDARGIRTCFQYDALGRLTAKNYSNGQGPVTYQYDQGGAAAFAMGRLTKVTDPSGSETYTYDTQGAGRITQLQKVVGTTTYTIGYEYNTAGQITKITYPSGRFVQQNVDNIGRLSSIADTKSGVNTTRASGYGYNNSQQVTGLSYGNGVNAVYVFSPMRDQITNLSYVKGAQTLFNLSYYYQQDPTNCSTGAAANDGEIDCIKDSVDSGRSIGYTYDSLGRAIAAMTSGSTGYPQWGLSWAYDRYGNRLNQTVTGGSAYSNTLSFANPGGAQTNRPDGLCFDLSGNLTAESGSCPPTSPMYTYDAENRMTAYAGGSAASYLYDDGAKRVKKCLPNCTSPTTSTVYIFSAGKDIAEYDNGAAPASPSREYIYSGGALLTTLAGSATTYHHQDHLSVRLSTDANGNKVGEQGHYPYGENWYQANTTTKFIYTGYERDSESGNDYAMARYYHVRFGRFCSPDPMAGSPGDPQSWNRYLYVRDNPVTNIDPSGLDWLSGFLAFLKAFFTANVDFSSTPPTFPAGDPGGLWQKVEDAIIPPLSGTTPPTFGLLESSEGDGAGGGGGGGTDWGSILLGALQRLRKTHCNDVFPLPVLKNYASNLHFYDARSADSPDANIKASAINPGISDKTLGEITSGQAATPALTLPERTANGGYQASNAVVLGSQFPNHTETQGDTLVHEETHAYFKLNDTQLWDVAQYNGAVANPKFNGNPSENYEYWIQQGCPDQGGVK